MLQVPVRNLQFSYMLWSREVLTQVRIILVMARIRIVRTTVLETVGLKEFKNVSAL